MLSKLGYTSSQHMFYPPQAVTVLIWWTDMVSASLFSFLSALSHPKHAVGAGDSALTICCGTGDMQFIELLVNSGANVNIETHIGKTPLIQVRCIVACVFASVNVPK